MPEDQHADQDEDAGNGIPDKVHPMDALTATEPVVFILDIKTILALHITNQPRQKSSILISGIDKELLKFRLKLFGRRQTELVCRHTNRTPQIG